MPIKLYIRKKPAWINYIHDVNEFNQFIDVLSDKVTVIGDVALFSNHMKNMLLKLLEERTNIHLYSSDDIHDPILLSRIAVIEKEPIEVIQNGLDLEAYEESNKGYMSVRSNLSILPSEIQLRSKSKTPRFIKFLVSQSKK